MSEKTNILIVGAGKGGKALIEIFTESETVNIIGVVDINQDSPGIKLAKELNIPTASGYKEFINNEGLNEVFNSTGSNKIQEELIRAKPAGVEIIDGYSAKFLWQLIEERKKAEEELRMAYTKLKETQAQLVQSAKIASLGLLAGGIAHEINNPLTGVLNNVQLIKMIAAQKKDFSLEDFKNLLTSIEESAQRCSNITRSLLDFSRASKGKIQGLSLNEVIEKTIILIEHELQLQNIVIQKELKIDLPLIKGDPQLIQQVIFNVVSNAKWSILNKPEKQTGVIVIKTDSRAADNMVSLEISDTGIGISKENLEKIFDPFFTTKLVGEGTGLGLSIVYNIIKEHNGVISAESEVGKGATFRILLPVYSDKEISV